jgi:hypothetical protein
MRIAYNKAVELSSLNDYILCHQLKMIGYRELGFLWKLDLPFVWGPVGGNGNVPVSFLRSIDSLGAVKQGLRILVNNYQIRFNSDVNHAIKKCASLITVNSLNRDVFKEI